jgi:hypothetical protein
MTFYDPKDIWDIIANVQQTWLSDRGINTKATSAQVFIDYLTVSTGTSFILFLHDPETSLTGGAKKGRHKNYLQ